MRPCADGEPAVAVVVVEVVGEALAADVEGEVLALANVGLQEFFGDCADAIARVGWLGMVRSLAGFVGWATQIGLARESRKFER